MFSGSCYFIVILSSVDKNLCFHFFNFIFLFYIKRLHMCCWKMNFMRLWAIFVVFWFGSMIGLKDFINVIVALIKRTTFFRSDDLCDWLWSTTALAFNFKQQSISFVASDFLLTCRSTTSRLPFHAFAIINRDLWVLALDANMMFWGTGWCHWCCLSSWKDRVYHFLFYHRHGQITCQAD